MAIRRKDFITEVLTDTDLEAVQDNANIQVDTVAELSSLPSTVNTAYVKADESIHIRRSGGWIKLAKEVSITAGTGISGGGSLNADRTISLNTSYTDGRYSLSSHNHDSTYAGKWVESSKTQNSTNAAYLWAVSIQVNANSTYDITPQPFSTNWFLTGTWSTGSSPLYAPTIENLGNNSYRVHNHNGATMYCHIQAVRG